MKLRKGPDGLMAESTAGGWVSLPALRESDPGCGLNEEQASDMIAFLSAGDDLRDKVSASIASAETDRIAADPETAGLPFKPRSMRAFMLFESHVIASSRVLVEKFFPAPMAKAVAGYEKVTRRTFPKLKPNRMFREQPTFYMANHAAVIGDGDPMWWPSHTEFLDFELELAFVIDRPLADATPEEAAEAVGGWFVLNDWSARDIQADDARMNIFGPVVKSKTFANSIGSDVLTADELPDWTKVTGRVRVDGEEWCSGITAGPAHDIGAMLAHVSTGECLMPGDVISTGTIPGCCGLEMDRWIKRGQTVQLEIDGIGTLTNRIDGDAAPGTGFDQA